MFEFHSCELRGITDPLFFSTLPYHHSFIHSHSQFSIPSLPNSSFFLSVHSPLLSFFLRPPSIMICSPRSNKPGSNWLDRLRSNKGIPTDDNLDLDTFILNLATHSPQPRPIKPLRHRPPITHDDPPLTTVLAHLFNPGAATITSKKCPRKQTNPKIFIPSSTIISTTTANAPAATGVDAAVDVENRGVEGEDGEEDFKGFTKSEITVIDTSCPVWKVDKFVFRRNNVWKIRERKQKNKFVAKKKSKSTHELDIHGIGSSKDNTINTGGEKPVKKLKVI